jgi:hypothetical protein
MNALLILKTTKAATCGRIVTLANTELAFKTNKKEKRAAELINANNELIFQNKEKLNAQQN